MVTLVVVGLSVLFAQNYSPPPKSARLWPDMPPAAATIISLIVVNSVILVLWKFPPAWRFLNQNFLSTPVYPSAFSILGNVFSHQEVKHFLANMVVLWFIGTKRTLLPFPESKSTIHADICLVHDDIGRGNFLALYLSCGVLGSFTSVSYCVARSFFHVSSLGSSGANAGVVAAWCIINSEYLQPLPPSEEPKTNNHLQQALLLHLSPTRFSPRLLVERNPLFPFTRRNCRRF